MRTPLVLDAFFVLINPLIPFLILIFFGKRMGKMSALASIGGSAWSLVSALLCLPHLLQGERLNWSATFADVGKFKLMFGLQIDPLTMMMIFVVTVVGTLIQIYSVGYMKGDKHYSRFFAYMSLFTFSMLGLVLSNNLFQLYIFWEGVGLCSYLLIAFWFERKAASDAGRKAFITTRIGDSGLLLGIFLLFFVAGNADFTSMTSLQINPTLLTLIALLIFCGAVGKSAQFPLHVWLPDAMEGPTPVSALIHAATMVAAGVYLVARCFPLFAASPVALETVAWIGTITAFMSAFIALTTNDIKRVLAYSTISQLGYMMVALGVGGFTAGTFHLMTHAFFKALLFLCAGSVIHGTGTQDLREMGGLWSKMKVTTLTCLVASLAISGIPPLSGFWSKDEILAEIFHSGNRVIFAVMMLTSFMTAFYMFRLCFLAFFGKPRKEIHAHESPMVMTIPLVILALFSIGIGLIGSPWLKHVFQHFIHPEAPVPVFDVPIAAVSSLMGLAGIVLAALFYLVKTSWPKRVAERLNVLYQISANKFWVDELYQRTVIGGTWALTRILDRFDLGVIDGAVDGTARQTVRLSAFKNWIDKYIVDGLVDFVGFLTRLTSNVVRIVQTGLVQNYILIVILGVLCIVMTGLMR